MHRLDIAESALKVVGGLSVLALLALLASPRPNAAERGRRQDHDDRRRSSIERTPGMRRREKRMSTMLPGRRLSVPNPAGPNVTYACRAGEPERSNGVCLSRSYARSDGKMYACWSCNPYDRTGSRGSTQASGAPAITARRITGSANQSQAKPRP